MAEGVFDALGMDGTDEAVVATPATEASNNAKKQKLEMMKEYLKETINTDPSYKQRLHALSGSLEVVNSLGFGENGNIIVDKTKSTDEGRTLTTTSLIVGYRVRNNSSEPIKYQTEVWTKGEDGKYVGEKVEEFIAPNGGTADLPRQYMTMLCAQPEISFQLVNGKVIRGSGAKASRGDIKAELEAYYFAFSKDINKEINSDEVKLNVGTKGPDGKWVVKPEFAQTFGFLENVPEKTRGSRKSGPKYSTSDLAANYVMKMIKETTM